MKLEINNTTKTKINNKLLQQAADVFGRKMKLKEKEVSLALVSAGRIKEFNRKYRGLDKVTDVLSFAGDGPGDFLGEILIYYPQIKRQAKASGIKIEDELVFIFVHGLLHLVGYDDQSESGREKMLKIGRELCRQLRG